MRRANGLDEFYSRTLKNDGVELFLGLDAQPTTGYPHVHVIHHGNGDVQIIASLNHDQHVWRTRSRSLTGNEVNEAIAEAGRCLIERVRKISQGLQELEELRDRVKAGKQSAQSAMRRAEELNEQIERLTRPD